MADPERPTNITQDIDIPRDRYRAMLFITPASVALFGAGVALTHMPEMRLYGIVAGVADAAINIAATLKFRRELQVQTIIEESPNIYLLPEKKSA